jgi:hypothetical protein
MSFAADLARIAKKQSKRLEEVDRGIKFRAFSMVARQTRVDTGRLRGDWQVTQDMPAAGPSGVEDKTPQGAGGLRPDELKKITPFANTFLTNTMPYAVVWEERDGMVARTIADIERIVKEEAAKP